MDSLLDIATADPIAMLMREKGPVTHEEWITLLEYRLAEVFLSKGLFRGKLGNMRVLDGTLYDNKPHDPHGVLNQRGIFFPDAKADLVDYVFAFAGIEEEKNSWMLVTIGWQWQGVPGRVSKAVATRVEVSSCSLKAIIEAGINPRELFDAMNEWAVDLRRRRLELYKDAMQLEATFAAQKMVVLARDGDE